MIGAVFVAALTLAGVEKAAIAHAPAVNEARARVGEQQALLDAARGGGLPHVLANYAEVPQAGSNGGTIQQRLTTVSGQVILGDLAARNPLIAQADAALRSAKASELNAERAERVRAIGLFIDAMRTREVFLLRSSILAAAQADRRAAFIRFKNGDVPHLDVVRTDVGVARAQADVATSRADEANALNNLATEIAMRADAVNIPTLSQAVVSA
ncbi:MAG: TolC family protein, partial [Candidatus Eremiobacteraeota bacterium]|nr:TolC family protein [Candidatus Eremiobacteraeota bacterium]